MTSKAEKIIQLYAQDQEGLTTSECAEYFLEKECKVLTGALQTGAGGQITSEEQLDLKLVGFAQDFIKDLAGDDGARALQTRARWLADRAVSSRFFICYWNCKAEDRKKHIDELADMGPLAAGASSKLVDAFLEDKNEEVRKSAEKALESIGEPAVIHLAKRLLSLDQGRQTSALRLLTKIGLPEEYKYLVQTLGLKEGEENERKEEKATTPEQKPQPVSNSTNVEPTEEDRVAGIVWMLEHGRPVPAADQELLQKSQSVSGKSTPKIEDMINMLEDESDHRRYGAVNELVKIGKPTVPFLIKALGNELWRVQASAALALAKIGAPEAVPHLMKLLDDPRPKARILGAGSLEEMGPVAMPANMALKSMANSDQDPEVRWAANQALQRIGGSEEEKNASDVSTPSSPKQVDARISDALDMLYMGDVHGDANKQERGVAILIGEGALAVPRIIGAIEIGRTRSWKVRARMIQALGKIGTPEAVAYLTKLLEDEDPQIRLFAVYMLGETGRRGTFAISALTRLLQDPDVSMREETAKAIANIQQPSVAPTSGEVDISGHINTLESGGEDEDEDEEKIIYAELLRICHQLGFPLAIQTTNDSGGRRDLYRVTSEADLAEAIKWLLKLPSHVKERSPDGKFVQKYWLVSEKKTNP